MAGSVAEKRGQGSRLHADRRGGDHRGPILHDVLGESLRDGRCRVRRAGHDQPDTGVGKRFDQRAPALIEGDVPPELFDDEPSMWCSTRSATGTATG